MLSPSTCTLYSGVITYCTCHAVTYCTTGKQIMAEEKRRQQEEEEDPPLKQDEDEEGDEEEEEGERVQPPKQLEYPGFGIITLTTEYFSNCAV